ncbi:O-antigen ligase family protein [Macrococcus brunensis]|uniref:O-antigen ligase family protein n=1 Tax=Macrococcus brunensis TaxID=198483 RepID=UPI001EF09471|nr:O-antigen ligase family protein [Macrococcus brunensis]ULG74948.1 O-antigen ligase family protein [Macrococcus brunensis]
MKNSEKYNSLIVSIFLFQFGILLPFNKLIEVEYLYIVCTALLLLISLIINRLKISLYLTIICIFIFIIFLSSYFIHSVDYSTFIFITISFVVKSLSAFYVASNKISIHNLINYLKKLSYINLFSIIVGIFIFHINQEINYMRIGYALVPSALILGYDVMRKENRIISLIFYLITCALMILYGNRGVFIVLILFLILYIIFIVKINFRNFILLTVLIISGYFLLISEFFKSIVHLVFVNYFNGSYVLLKFNKMIEEGFVSSLSGRDDIYKDALNYFIDSPIIGNGFGYSFSVSDTSFHNFVLQIAVEFGIVGLILFCIISLIILKILLQCNSKEWKITFLLFLSLAMGRLLVSSDIWLRTELWIFFGLVINYLTFNNKAGGKNEY